MRLPIAIGLLATVWAGAAAPAAETPKPPAPAAAKATPAVPKDAAATVLHFLPKARPSSTYTLEGRFDIADRNVTFETPDAYKDGFAFWAARMKGQKRGEAYEIVTVTQEADASGNVPFRRTIQKFDLEFERQGQAFATVSTLERDLRTVVWEGTLDPSGTLNEKHKVSGKDNPEIDTLAIPEMERVFPSLKGARDIKIGEGFREERVVPLPTKLNIAGLEDTTLTMTREYTLKSVDNGLATFDVKTTYANDPGFKAKADNTSCSIRNGSGSAAGEAVFEVKRGVFVRTRLASSMRIDVEAPLRPLPGHPETDKPSLGKSHIDLDIVYFADQTVKRAWGEDKD